MALAGVIGVSLSAVQLLPLAEGILNSSTLMNRQAGAPTGVSLLKTILLEWRSWPLIITTILPQFFGTPIDNSYWYPYYNYNAQTFYAGIVPLALGLVTTLHWYNCRRGATGNPIDGSSIHSAGASGCFANGSTGLRQSSVETSPRGLVEELLSRRRISSCR